MGRVRHIAEWILAGLALSALVAFAAQDGGEAPTARAVGSLGTGTPVAVGMTGDSEDGYHAIAVADFARKRLTHVCTHGIVTLKKREADGDIHLRVSDGDAFIVAEIIPQLPLPAPKLHDTVEVCGTRRYDDAPGHGWWEVHPVERVVNLSASPAVSARH